MSAAKRRFFSGNTIEQAVISAASAFGLEPSEVAYKQVEKKHGFLKVRRRVVIEVDATAPRREAPGQGLSPVPQPVRIAAERIGEPPPAEAPSPRSPIGPVSPPVAPPVARPSAAPAGPPVESRRAPEARGAASQGGEPRREAVRDSARSDRPGGGAPRESRENQRETRPAARPGTVRQRDRSPREERAVLGGALGEAAAEALGRTLALIDHDVSGRVYPGEERLAVEISGRDTRYFLEEHGRALFSLEHLLPKLVRGLSGEGVFLKVDCENFREDREQELRQLALEVADEVAETGRPETLDWLNPAERRIVHVALADNPDVTTESGGSGYLKQLTVYPADGDREGGNDSRHHGDFED
jgi:spoIIIJ-associated protein